MLSHQIIPVSKKIEATIYLGCLLLFRSAVLFLEMSWSYWNERSTEIILSRLDRLEQDNKYLKKQNQILKSEVGWLKNNESEAKKKITADYLTSQRMSSLESG